jgi:phosphopantothenoylcysteine decarboxylase/phosphopantothenate--cysteine ligase
MVAAVSDFRPASRAAGKLSRRGGGPGPLPLTANPDLLAELGRGRPGARPVLVGFAAEAGGDLIESARAKLAEKRCDVIAANDVTAAGLGFGSDRNALTLVFADGRVVPLSAGPKDTLAAALWTALVPIITAAEAVRDSGGTVGLGAP